MKTNILETIEKITHYTKKFTSNLYLDTNEILPLDASYQEIEEDQKNKLTEVTKKAKNTEFYSNRFKKINLKKVENIKDLETLLVTDLDLRKNKEKMRNPSCFFYFTQSTSGTGGNPVNVDISLRQLMNVYPIHKRCMKSFKIDEKDNGVIILHRGSPSYYLALANCLLISGKVEFADYRNLNEQLMKIKGKDYVVAYSTPLLRLAQHPKIEKISKDIKIVVYTAEPLPEEGKKIVKEVFDDAEIRSIYGSIETYGPVGFLCKNENFHVNPDFVTLENDKNNNAIVTCLDKDRGTILIRYSGLKDKVKFVNCTCKLNYPAFGLEGGFRHLDGYRIANAIYASEAFKNGIIGPYFDFTIETDIKYGRKLVKIVLEKNKEVNLKKVKEELVHTIIHGGGSLPPSKPLKDFEDMLKFKFNFVDKIDKIKTSALRRGYNVT